jgi:hypothetical protein
VLTGFRSRDAVCELLPFDAVSVAVSAVLTADAVTAKPALVVPAAIATDAGKATDVLLLARVTVVLLLTAWVSVTVHATDPAPVSVALAQLIEASCAEAEPPEPPEPPPEPPPQPPL